MRVHSVFSVLLTAAMLTAGGCDSIKSGRMTDVSMKSTVYAIDGKARGIDRLGDFLYLCGPMSSQVAKIDLKTGKQTRVEASYIEDAHGLRVYDGFIWVADIKTHQIYKLAADGKQLFAFGEKNIFGCDKTHLYKPTDVAVFGDRIYITDGYGNRRIVCIDSHGRYLFEWGTAGTGPGQFNNPHNIAVVKEKVFIADRDNNRVQVFTLEGVFIAEWPQPGKVFGLDIFEDKLYLSIVADSNDFIIITDLEGNELSRAGQKGDKVMEFRTPHSLAADRAGIYIADMENQRVQVIPQEM